MTKKEKIARKTANHNIPLYVSENDMWNELFENKTKHLTEEFLKAFEHNYIKS